MIIHFKLHATLFKLFLSYPGPLSSLSCSYPSALGTFHKFSCGIWWLQLHLLCMTKKCLASSSCLISSLLSLVKIFSVGQFLLGTLSVSTWTLLLLQRLLLLWKNLWGSTNLFEVSILENGITLVESKTVLAFFASLFVVKTFSLISVTFVKDVSMCQDILQYLFLLFST